MFSYCVHHAAKFQKNYESGSSDRNMRNFQLMLDQNETNESLEKIIQVTLSLLMIPTHSLSLSLPTLSHSCSKQCNGYNSFCHGYISLSDELYFIVHFINVMNIMSTSYYVLSIGYIFNSRFLC